MSVCILYVYMYVLLCILCRNMYVGKQVQSLEYEICF